MKSIKEKYENKFDEYGKINEDEMNENIIEKLGELPNHDFLKQLSLNDLL